MKRQIRRLDETDLARVSEIADLAYPPYGDKKTKRAAYLQSALTERRSGEFYGCFEGERMVGFMELYDFRMNLRGKLLPAGGVGFVAVDIFHKRQGVAGEMLAFYEDHFRKRDVAVLILYPFNIGFYHKRGFCCATRMHQYRVQPAMFPCGGRPEHVRLLGKADRQKLKNCFYTYFTHTNGMIMKRDLDIDNLMRDCLIAAYEKDGVVEGYAAYRYEKVNPDYVHMDNMVVSEWIWNSREAFAELCSFFHGQSDQITRVIVNTPEENLHLALSDPSNGCNDAFKNLTHEICTTAADSMYKVINPAKLFGQLEGVNFGGGNLTLRLEIADGTFNLQIAGGIARATDGGEPDAAVKMGTDAFTALITGAADFLDLYEMGLAETDRPEMAGEISRVFFHPRRPKTMTYF